MRVTNTDSFILKSKTIHGDHYDYSKSNYTRSCEKIEIVCKDHGSFWQIARDHYNSKAGCPSCAGTKRLTNLEFMQKAKKIHNNKYLYPDLNYKNNRGTIKILCPTHGEFKQTATDHLSGKSCSKCVKELRMFKKTIHQDAFIKRCLIVHGDKYDYSLTKYTKMNDEIIVICRVHGIFRQKANTHQRGSGCLECARASSNYNRGSFVEFCSKNKFGLLYLIKCFNDNESFFKIGITSKLNVLNRFKRLGDMPYKYIVLGTIYGDPKNIWNMEKFLHRELSPKRHKPEIWFKGATECFHTLNKETLSLFGVQS